ncbi:MAG: T9SS type A sorting domain-containing protein [Candidatus Marinimicrobia bacterium]|nr:T9SS type A sorting domain-containing protein [Candidatus Neomarinimicrobiota bacterium]
MLNSNQVCDQDREIPIIHIHGTADDVVNYYPPSFDGSLTVGESIDYWSDYNNLTIETVDSISENIEKYTYANESLTKFVHFKVIGGGHDWFYGTSEGFHSSVELIDFFLEYKLSDFQTVDIVEGQSSDLPTNFILHQNYPNPFNPSTTIRFSLEKQNIISLQVFDLRGRLIKTLLMAESQPGDHEIQWNGYNDLEEAVSNGVYLYSIRTENEIQSRKMILLK